MLNVSDEEILEAMRATGGFVGIFAEPAAAAAVAGVRRGVREKLISPRASVLAVITGNGLKDIRAAQSAVSEPFEVAPDGAGLEEALQKRDLIG